MKIEMFVSELKLFQSDGTDYVSATLVNRNINDIGDMKEAKFAPVPYHYFGIDQIPASAQAEFAVGKKFTVTIEAK